MASSVCWIDKKNYSAEENCNDISFPAPTSDDFPGVIFALYRQHSLGSNKEKPEQSQLIDLTSRWYNATHQHLPRGYWSCSFSGCILKDAAAWALPQEQELFWCCNTQQQFISGEAHKLCADHCVYTLQLAVLLSLSLRLIAGNPSTGLWYLGPTLEAIWPSDL